MIIRTQTLAVSPGQWGHRLDGGQAAQVSDRVRTQVRDALGDPHASVRVHWDAKDRDDIRRAWDPIYPIPVHTVEVTAVAVRRHQVTGFLA